MRPHDISTSREYALAATSFVVLGPDYSGPSEAFFDQLKAERAHLHATR